MNDEHSITLAQGGGGPAGNRLIREEILSRFGNPALSPLPDAASLPGDLVFSTDSFVVTPRFFPGGNIGKLAVCGTVNDIAVAGGIPQYLSLAMILEEGLPKEELRQILDAAAACAETCGVTVVTGDTKVLPRGMVDGIYLNTAGIGRRNSRLSLGQDRIRPGDAVLVSGSIGEHGMAVMAARHRIGGEGVKSDCAPLAGLILAAAEAAGGHIRFMRDPTRGGVGAVVEEAVTGTGCGIELELAALPKSPAVATLASMLGIDPLFAACEGRVVMIVDPAAEADLLALCRRFEGGEMAARIGTVNDDAGRVTLLGEWGGRRLMIQPDGDQLPRIC